MSDTLGELKRKLANLTAALVSLGTERQQQQFHEYEAAIGVEEQKLKPRVMTTENCAAIVPVG